MTKSGGKKNKKMENGKGTSSEGTPPPISDTVNILSQTRQMMDKSPMMLSPNGGQSYHMNTMNMNYPVNLNTSPQIVSNDMCKVNNASGNVNNTPSVMPQGGQQHQNIKSNMGQNYNLDHQPGLVHAPYISQTFPVNQAFQAFPTSQTFPTSQSNPMAARIKPRGITT